MDALTENGYVDDAWRLITREEYPSIGYMRSRRPPRFGNGSS